MVRQIINVLHKANKNPLPLFFVDLKPTSNSSDIFHLSSILHTKIKIEEPYKTKSISQYYNCQQYGHTKAYCGYQPRCVRCGLGYLSSMCPNSHELPTKCALCSQNHPANYKGCTIYERNHLHQVILFMKILKQNLQMYKLATQLTTQFLVNPSHKHSLMNT
jgi:hypothetical protein